MVRRKASLSGFEPDYAHGRWVNTPAEPKPLPTLRVLASRGVEAGSPRLKPWEDVTLRLQFVCDTIATKDN